MADNERNFEFKEIPDSFFRIENRVRVLKRKVLLEKTEKSDNLSIYRSYMASFMEDAIKDYNLKGVLIEKDHKLLETKRAFEASRKKRFDFFSQYVSNIKSDVNDITTDITSLEKIDFNKPCTEEELLKIKKEFDFYVYPQSIDEIPDIKLKDIDGADPQRLNYFRPNEISEEIKQNFSNRTEKRVDDNYLDDCYKKIKYTLRTNSKTRRVIIEKTDYPTIPFFGTRKLIREQKQRERINGPEFHTITIYNPETFEPMQRHIPAINEYRANLFDMLFP